MRNRNGAVIVLLTLFLLNGCGEKGPAPGVDLDAQYALDVKVKTLDFVAQWHKNKNAAKGQLDGLAEQLNAYESMPVGEHGETYRQLRDATQKVHSTYASATAEQVDAMKAIAEKLPGDPAAGARDPN
jgi:hypothetical protein